MRHLPHILMGLLLVGGVAWGIEVLRDNAGDTLYQFGLDGEGLPSALAVDATNNLWVRQKGSEAEDDAHTSADYGVPALVVRKNTAASLCTTDADYSMLIVDTNGRLHVIDPSTTTAATNTGTIAGDTTDIAAAVEATGWTITRAVINIAAGARTAIVAAAGEGKAIRVLGLMGTADVAGSITIESGANALSGVIPLAAKGGVVYPVVPSQNVLAGAVWFETVDNEALNITTVTCTFDGVVVYATEN